jgi:hypothetical protein
MAAYPYGRARPRDSSVVPDPLRESEVASLLDRGFHGLAKVREHWHAPVGDRRTKDRLSDAQRRFNRMQAGLRAAALICLGRWLHRVPPYKTITDTLIQGIRDACPGLRDAAALLPVPHG